MTRLTYCITMILSLSVCLYAQELKPPNINWQATDSAGKAVAVPLAKHTTVLLFVMANQNHSHHAMRYAQQVIAGRVNVQMISVISGADALGQVSELLNKTQWKLPLVVDSKYEASGKMLIRVWPTTLVIAEDGKLLVHIGGCPSSYSKNLAAYLDFAEGKINQAALKLRLAEHHVVGSTQNDIARRHLQLAQGLIARGDFVEARSEINKCLNLTPGDVKMRLALARVDLLTEKPQETIKTLDQLDVKKVAPWRINALRGRALVALKQWDEARSVLGNAIKLNPEPSEVHYAMGMVYAHDKNWQQAAESFRLAFETSDSGKAMAIPLR
ncbi:tetratricopeptide repeat protein [bacterium AH-315-I18]|nr:tetratricopeptide repeat protein [Phycisphaeraceae bacterium]MBN4061011.1 tetratricopeptide repeat protein [bacterium AH-315-I18]